MACLVRQGPGKEKMKKYGIKNWGEEAYEFAFVWIEYVHIFVLHVNIHPGRCMKQTDKTAV